MFPKRPVVVVVSAATETTTATLILISIKQTHLGVAALVSAFRGARQKIKLNNNNESAMFVFIAH